MFVNALEIQIHHHHLHNTFSTVIKTKKAIKTTSNNLHQLSEENTSVLPSKWMAVDKSTQLHKHVERKSLQKILTATQRTKNHKKIRNQLMGELSPTKTFRLATEEDTAKLLLYTQHNNDHHAAITNSSFNKPNDGTKKTIIHNTRLSRAKRDILPTTSFDQFFETYSIKKNENNFLENDKLPNTTTQRSDISKDKGSSQKLLKDSALLDIESILGSLSADINSSKRRSENKTMHHSIARAKFATTKNLKELFIGRCYEYQFQISLSAPYTNNNNKNSTNKNSSKEIKHWDCGKLWDAFFQAFAYKTACEVKMDDYKEVLGIMEENVPVDKVTCVYIAPEVSTKESSKLCMRDNCNANGMRGVTKFVWHN